MSSTMEQQSKRTEIPVGPRLQSVLEIAYRARRPVLLEGVTGIGKSEIIADLAQRMGIGFTVLDLSLLEPPDLVGLPYIEGGRTTYARPSILPQDGEGILMLEELNRAERYIQQPALQLLTARRLHEYVLPEGWSTCAAINPQRGEYQVTPMDPAMRARFLFLTVRADRGTWLRWAHEQHLHSAVLQLASSHERLFEQVSPRTWKYVSDILYTLSPEECHNITLMWDLLSGYLPPLWIEILLSQSALLAPDDDVDVSLLLHSLHQDKEMESVLHSWRDEGQTDRLQQVGLRVLSVIEGPELGALLGQGRFSLQAFETLLSFLQGDFRETLQDAFGSNPLSVLYFHFDFDDFFRNYKNSALYKQNRQWRKQAGLSRHCWLACQTALCSYVEQQANLGQFRRKNPVKRAMGWLLAQWSEDAMPLVRVLQKHGIEPIAPRS